MTDSLDVRPFGRLPTGEMIDSWTLTGASGLTLEVLTYGGIVRSLLVPDPAGAKVDVVLGCADLADYVAGHPCFGAIVGRVAGRITGAGFTLDGKVYRLSKNEPPNHLHGGSHGFHEQVWRAVPVPRADQAPSLQLAYCSVDGEEGYPGTVAVCVTYTITNDNVFLIETTAETDKPTPLSLTHHSYFNLAGEGSGTIGDHTLEVEASEFVSVDDDLTLLDKTEPVFGLAEDLRTATLLAEAIPRFRRDHGALYRLARQLPGSELARVARLRHPPSGRVLTCFTNASYLQIYTASAFNGSCRGKSGVPYPRYAGLCLECEGYPNAVNAPAMDDTTLLPGVPQRRTTAYAFSVNRTDT